MYKMTIKKANGEAINLYYDSKADAVKDSKAIKAAYGNAVKRVTISNH